MYDYDHGDPGMVPGLCAVLPQVYGPWVQQVVCGERQRYHEATEAAMTRTKGEADGHRALRR